MLSKEPPRAAMCSSPIVVMTDAARFELSMTFVASRAPPSPAWGHQVNYWTKRLQSFYTNIKSKVSLNCLHDEQILLTSITAMSIFSFSNKEKAIPVRIWPKKKIMYIRKKRNCVKVESLVSNLKMTQGTIFLLNRLLNDGFDWIEKIIKSGCRDRFSITGNAFFDTQNMWATQKTKGLMLLTNKDSNFKIQFSL